MHWKYFGTMEYARALHFTWVCQFASEATTKLLSGSGRIVDVDLDMASEAHSLLYLVRRQHGRLSGRDFTETGNGLDFAVGTRRSTAARRGNEYLVFLERVEKTASACDANSLFTVYSYFDFSIFHLILFHASYRQSLSQAQKFMRFWSDTYSFRHPPKQSVRAASQRKAPQEYQPQGLSASRIRCLVPVRGQTMNSPLSHTRTCQSAGPWHPQADID